MVEMTSGDLLTLKMVLIEPPRNIKEQSFSFPKFIIFVELERKNDFSGNLASYSLKRLG